MLKLLCVSVLLCLLFFLSGCDEPSEQIINNYYTTSDSLTNPKIALRVVSTNPSNNEVGPFSLNNLQPDINIQFNKLLDPSSLNEYHFFIAEGNGSPQYLYYHAYYPERFPYLLKLSTSSVIYKAEKHLHADAQKQYQDNH